MASLNERAKVEYIVAEGLLNHHLYKDQNDLHEKVMNALHEVGLLPEFASRFPTSSRAASVSVSASPVRWSWSRSSSWPTSPSLLWTSPSVRRC